MKKILFVLIFLSVFLVDAQQKIGYTRNATYTTVQRNAIDVSDATIIYRLYNSDNDRWEQYNHDTDLWEADASAGATNLSTTQSSTTVTINSDTGSNAVIPLGDGTNSGISLNNYTNTEKNKLAGIEEGATANSPDNTLLNRANHTGTQTVSTISDFDTEVSNNGSVVANTAKVTNATHTGEVTGSSYLTLAATAISNKTSDTSLTGTEEVLINDGGLKKTTTQAIANLSVSASISNDPYDSSWEEDVIGGATRASLFNLFNSYLGYDATNVKLTGAQTIDNVKTFTSFPILPSSSPTTDYQAAHRKFVLDNIAATTVDRAPRNVTSTAGIFTEAYNESQPNVRLNVTEDTNISITEMNADDALIFSVEETAGTERRLQFIGTDTLDVYVKNELIYLVGLKDTIHGFVWQRSYTDGKTDKVRSITGTGVTTIDWSITPYYDFTHGAMNDTLVFVAPKSSKPLQLKRTQDATGSRTIAYASDIDVAGGTLPTLTSTANATDIINFFYNKESDKYILNGVELALQTVTGTPSSAIVYDEDAEDFMLATGIPDDDTVYYASTPQEITGHELWVAVDNRIKGFKFYNLWDEIYADYPFIGGTSSTHKWNTKNPVDTDAAFRLTFGGTWTHNGVGITGNGSDTYANTHFTKNNGWTSTNVGYSFYNRSSFLETKFDFGLLTTAETTNRISFITSRATTAQMNSYMFVSSGGGSVNVTTPTTLGLISVSQSGNSHKVFTNAVQQGSTNTGNEQSWFTTLSSNPMFFGAANLTGAANLPSSRNYSSLSITNALTDTETANFNTVIQAFETALGREM